MATSQHRCVFVGNIPYDATEEQLIEICREVGPVVSFRLVLDRETGKPKGYGFCEYKDEETALSARRNLQGYQINGRQLRVDFAENDKGSDRSGEQGRGRGGPGAATNAGGPAVQGELLQNQPIGLHLAITAATVMAGALGGMQTGLPLNQNGLLSQPAATTDPLTLHMARMSRNQLSEIMSDLKTMTAQNKEQARELLLARPQLLKAIFQAQIMLGLVTPQVLQTPNIRQPSGPSIQTLLQHSQQQAVQTLPGLPPLAQKVPASLMPKVPESQMSGVLQNTLAQNKFPATLPSSVDPRLQHSQVSSKPNLPLTALHGQSGIPKHPTANASLRSQVLANNSPSSIQQIQPQSAHNSQALPNATLQPTLMPRPSASDAGFQPGTSITQSVREKASRVHSSSETISRPTKMVKLEDGRSTPFPTSVAPNITRPGPSQPFVADSRPLNQIKLEPSQPNSQISQPQLPPDVESVLLQQVLNLTPEQLSSLTPEQQQQVLQLQQALRKDQMQPS